MKKLLIIVLLIVGCDNSTESSVNPIVGTWKWTFTTNTIQYYHQESVVETINNENNIDLKYTFNEDETYIYGEIEGTWIINSNTITLKSSGNSDEYNYSISNNILSISYNITNESYCSSCQSWHSETITILKSYTKQ